MEVRIKCKTCKDYTQSVDPSSIKKVSKNFYLIKVRCAICGNLKYKKLNEAQRKILPQDIINIPENLERNSFETAGGIIPLLALIPAIAAGISAITGVAGTVASSVINSKKANEERRHNEQMEQITKDALGKGIDKDKFNESVNYLQGKGFKISI
jgi:hypothetical protein